MDAASEKPRLTSLAHGGGCGCKLAPSVLQDLLSEMPKAGPYASLLVGTETADDAAVWDLDGTTSVIATTDNEHWITQRSHLNDVFLPEASLAKIFPTSLARAKVCAERLEELRQQAGKYGVQMHDFFLHEAQAQLQPGLDALQLPQGELEDPLRRRGVGEELGRDGRFLHRKGGASRVAPRRRNC